VNTINEHQKIATWLKEKREQAGLTQAQLAKLIGRHPSFVGHYESGKRLEIVKFFEIVAALNAKPDDAISACLEKVQDAPSVTAKFRP
jgi:transcriptional regulator with XRE-family HTH domain